MKITVFASLLVAIVSTHSAIADHQAPAASTDGVKMSLLEAGFGKADESETTQISKGEYHSSLISPPRGRETIVHAVANDPNSRITILIYNDATGNLIDRVTSDEPNPVCRFIPEGDLYRVKVKVVDAGAPTIVRLISASRCAEAPLATGIIASIKP